MLELCSTGSNLFPWPELRLTPTHAHESRIHAMSAWLSFHTLYNAALVPSVSHCFVRSFFLAAAEPLPSLPPTTMHLLSPLSPVRRETRHDTGSSRPSRSISSSPSPLPTNIVNRSPHLHLTLLPRPSISQWQLLTLAIILMGLLHCTRYFKPLHRTTHTRTKVGITATLFSSPPFSS